MSTIVSPHTRPPTEVLTEFLRLLHETIDQFEESLVPVVRGSLLLHRWFGDLARPPADVDLECFAGPRRSDDDEDEQYLPPDQRVGRYGTFYEYVSLVDFGKAMCRYAATTAYRPTGNRAYYATQPSPTIAFEDIDPPAEGSSLWVYGSPGERYFAGWFWKGPPDRQGAMQVDISQANTYRLDDVPTDEVTFTAPDGQTFAVRAYSQEMMLAAKLSWLLRSFQRAEDGSPLWAGDLKDVFDAHLLLTRGAIDPGRFRQALRVVTVEDNLNWGNVELLMAAGRGAVTTDDFPRFDEFCVAYPQQAHRDPASMLAEAAAKLGPLLGLWYPQAEMPFLLAIQADPVDEANFLVYADWLEDRGDLARSGFAREFARYYFHEADLGPARRQDASAKLRAWFDEEPEQFPWLVQLFGSPQRLHEVRQRLGNTTAAS